VGRKSSGIGGLERQFWVFAAALQSPYGLHVSPLRSRVFSGKDRRCLKRCATGAGRQIGDSMTMTQQLDLLLYVPTAFASAFMLWVFWSLAKQLKKR